MSAVDAVQEDADAYNRLTSELERYFEGARTAHQAYLVLDAMKGRALAAEERLTAVRRLVTPPYPDVVPA